MDDDEKYEAFQVEKGDFDISDKEYKESIDEHEQQCPTIFDKGMASDHGLKKLIAISHKMGKPYIAYLHDTYDRDRVIAYNKKNSDMYLPGKWALSNKHIININNMGNAELRDQVVGAVTTFGNRIAPRLMYIIIHLFSEYHLSLYRFDASQFIEDSLHNVCEHIAVIVNFVYKLAEDKKRTCPFQYDVS